MAAASELSKEVRDPYIPARLQGIRDAFASVFPNFQEQEREHLVRIVLLLSSSAMIRAFKHYLDLSGEEAAETVAWAILKLAYAGGSGGEGDTGKE
jgi:cation transport regulator ChaB